MPGGSGQVGQMLARHLQQCGHHVTVLTRGPYTAAWQTVHWDGLNEGPWTETFEGADVCINLSGKSVNCRYNEINRQEIYDSRVGTTRLLNRVIARLAEPPHLWLNSSTASTKLKELIIVRTSQVNETPYCLASHTILAKNLGWSDEQLSHLAQWSTREDFTPAEKAALQLAESVTRDAHAISDDQFAELRSFFSEGEIVELLCAIGLFNYFNRFNNALRMEPTKPGEGGCAAHDSVTTTSK